ncbi:MAG: hypothetical protein ACREPU_00235 [Rhodanobacteraceae bacterium]
MRKRAEVMGTWPAGETVTLGPNQSFYLHLRYTSDRPVRIWARPYFQGKQVNVGSNPSRTFPAGSGEALGWFFLMQPDEQVDEVCIGAGDGSTERTPVVATYPVSISGGGDVAQTSPQPAWVANLRAADAAAQRAAYKKSMNTPMTAGDSALFNGFMLAMFGIGILGFAWPAWGLWRWRGGWQVAVAVPAALMVFVVLRLAVDVTRDPASHNLWPFEILQAGGLSVVIMLVLQVARKITSMRHAS